VARGVVVIDLILVGSALFAARKTVRENLVKDLIVNPLRAVIRIIDGKLLQPCRRETAKALRGKPQLAVVPQQLKAVAAARLSAVQIDIRPPGGNPGCGWLRSLCIFSPVSSLSISARSVTRSG
jgi:hypothetical protein